jgi:type I restriction enzyme S subunit
MWKTVKLGEICDINIGKTPSRSNKKYWDIERTAKNVWVSIADLSALSDRYISDSREYISDEGAALFSEVPVDTLIMSFKLSIGKMAITERALRTNEAIAALIIKNQREILRDYLFYFLGSQDWDRLAGDDVKIKGKTLNKAKLKELEIHFPPLREQQRIVAKLDRAFEEIDRAIEATELSIENGADLLNAYVAKLITEETDDSRKCKIEDLISELITGPFGSSLHKSDYINDGIPVINPQNIVNQNIEVIDGKSVGIDTAERLSRFRIRAGDILLARRGEMGRCALATEDHEGWLCGTGCMIVRANEHVSPEYLAEVLGSRYVSKALESGAIGATMLNLNQNILNSIAISIRNFAEQKESIRKIECYKLQINILGDLNRLKVGNWQSLKSAILAQELKGPES